MTLSAIDLSRAASHALRHEPWLYELEMDEEGWAPVDQLLAALNERGGDWEPIDRAALERMLALASKRRHELNGDHIRALYGHSVPWRVLKNPAPPPDRLFHGTRSETWSQIQVHALLPMRRQFVHLSVDLETAISVGRRKGDHPIVLTVDARAAASAGITFYEGNEFVFLADSIPAQFLAPAEQ